VERGWSRALGGKILAQAGHRGVDEEADICDRERRDAADFLVAETILKLEPDDFLLIARQMTDQLK